MTQKTLSNVTIGDRLISLDNQALLRVVSSHEGNPVLIEDQGECDADRVFETIGVVIPLDKLAEDGFLKIFEIAPYVNDAIVALVDGKWVTGSVIIVSDNLVTFAPTTSLADRPLDGVKAVLVNRKDVHVIYPVPRDDVPVLVSADVVVVINPLNQRFGEVCGVVDPIYNGFVSVEFLDGSGTFLRAFEVALYTREDQISVLGAELLPNASNTSDEESVDFSSALSAAITTPDLLFGPTFVPANVSTPQPDGADYNAIGDCFSIEELHLILDLSALDEELAANLLGVVILEGREIADPILRALLGQSIPYGFSQFIPDATAFFKLVGEIANEQAKEKIDALFSGDIDAAMARPVSASDLAFSRITGFDQDQSKAIMASELDEDEVKDLTDGYAQRATEGYRLEPEVVNTSGFGLSTEILDNVFGAGNYRLLSADEASAVFGDDAFSAIAEGGVFGEVLSGQGFDDILSQSMRDSEAALSDVLSGDAGINLGDLLAQIAGTPAKPVPAPKVYNAQDADDFRDGRFAEARIDIDECLAEFSTLSQAGRTDSHVLSKQIETQVDKQRILVESIAADVGKATEAIAGINAGLRLLVETNADTERLAGNARMLQDAFDALVTDVTNLQVARGTL